MSFERKKYIRDRILHIMKEQTDLATEASEIVKEIIDLCSDREECEFFMAASLQINLPLLHYAQKIARDNFDKFEKADRKGQH